MNPSTRSRRARWWGAWLVVALLAAAGVWWAKSRPVPVKPAPPPQPDTSFTTLSSSPALAVLAALDDAEPPAAAAQAASSPESPASAAVVDASCPAEWRAMSRQKKKSFNALYKQLGAEANRRAAGLLMQSSDVFERVLGKLLFSSDASIVDRPLSLNADQSLALVTEALQSNDARVVTLALNLCDRAPAAQVPACASMQAQRWAEVDGDNVQAWIAVAEAAIKRGDEAGAAAAFRRAGQASASRNPWTPVTQVANSPTLATLSPMDQHLMRIHLIGVSTASMALDFSKPMRWCGQEMGAEDRRVADCAAIASVLVDRSGSLLDRALGVGLGQKSGWAPERVDELRAEQRALGDALLADIVVPVDADPANKGEVDPEAVACDQFKRLDRALRVVTQGDEVRAARAALRRAQAASAALASTEAQAGGAAFGTAPSAAPVTSALPLR